MSLYQLAFQKLVNVGVPMKDIPGNIFEMAMLLIGASCAALTHYIKIYFATFSILTENISNTDMEAAFSVRHQ